MKIHLAGSGLYPYIDNNFFDFYRLESFFHISKKEIPYINKYKRFLLDSGAFGYLAGKDARGVDWDKYIHKYANFIIDNNIKYFFELDIDPIIGLENVEILRKNLENKTNRKCIPVWHKSRGKEKWLSIIKDYGYVAIGGIVTKEITKNEYKFFNWFLSHAKKNDCKVHGLGFTAIRELHKYKFYSVDSTNWQFGNRYGNIIYEYKDGKLLQHNGKKDNTRIKHAKVAKHNFFEWVKFSKYAEKNL
jgi:hypothetical protein